MKKRRFLANKLNILMTILSVVLSSFFYVPIEAEAGKTTIAEKSFYYYHAENDITHGNTYIDDGYSYFDFEYRDDYYVGDGSQVEYYLGATEPVFTSSPDYYGYRIVFRQSKYVRAKSDYALFSRWLCGTKTDLMNGGYVANFDDIKAEAFAFYVPTDHAQVQILLAPLFLFELWEGASYDIGLDFNLTIEGFYTESEYMDSISSIENKLDKQQAEMEETNNRLDSLQNGFDNSAGDAMNDDLSASLNDYQIAEESLFTSAKSGLEGFQFVPFSSYPALVSSLSFVTGLMTALFGAVGGESGPVGIVLAILFSIMLVSLAIGLYRFYQSDGKSGGGKKGGDG